jgi:hypothetical protein
MTGQATDYGRAAEVRLRQDGLLIEGAVTDEHGQAHPREVKSMNMRGARREVTEALAGLGYDGADRWREDEQGASVRKFRRVRWR